MKVNKCIKLGGFILALIFQGALWAAESVEQKPIIIAQDGNFVLKFSGVLQADYRDYLNDNGATQFSDQFLLRRVRPTLEGTLNKNFAFKVTADFANGGGTTPGPNSTLLVDAYMDWQKLSAARVRVGKFKPPLGLENLQSDPVLFFIERSVVTQLVPIRDAGAMLGGAVNEGVLSYQLAMMNGVVDGTAGETDTGDGKDYLGRIFYQPFKNSSSQWWNEFGLGVAASQGDQFGTATGSNLTAGYKTDGQQTFFTYQSGTFADGARRRISPQAYWYTRHVGLLGEYVSSSQEISRFSGSTTTAKIENYAWQIAGSVVLTGERPAFGGVKPKAFFDPQNHQWGAFELVGRYAIFKTDDDAFTNGFASANASARKAKAWSTGVNWYPSNYFRLSSNYAVTSFDGGAAGAQNRPTEKVILSRIQLSF